MLRLIRQSIRSAVPKAEETLSYGMPYYRYCGRLAYFGAFPDHVSYFVLPGRSVETTFANAIAPYRTGKATLQFPIGTKVPVTLIRRLAKARARENEARRAGAAPRRSAAATNPRPRRRAG